MKREFLKSIEGLTDEAIDKIMAEAGKDVEAAKAKAGQATEKLTQELENAKQFQTICLTTLISIPRM